MSTSAFRATYADFKLIKTRGVVSVSFELPVEQAQAALDVLGGMPIAATEVWCAVARLETKTPLTAPNPETSAHSKQAFRDMRMVNQAGILCDDVAFRKFLAENFKRDITSADDAAAYVREYCGVKSRSDIRPRCFSGNRWTRLVDEYRTWMHAPDMAS